MIYKNPETEPSAKYLLFILGILSAMVMLSLVSCNQDTEYSKPGDHGIVTRSRPASPSECEFGGSSIDMYFDVDDSKTVTTRDMFVDTVSACDSKPVAIPPGKGAKPTPTPVVTPAPTPSPVPKKGHHEKHKDC